MKRLLRFLLAFFILGTLNSAFADDDNSSACPSPTPPTPTGLDPSKVNLAIYNNLPGIQPPTLDLDGRDLSAEGLSMVNTAAPAIVLPGMPTAASTPQPFPSPAPQIP
jgi:hypothetical protein